DVERAGVLEPLDDAPALDAAIQVQHDGPDVLYVEVDREAEDDRLKQRDQKHKPRARVAADLQDLLVDDRPQAAKRRAVRGWRGRQRGLTGHFGSSPPAAPASASRTHLPASARSRALRGRRALFSPARGGSRPRSAPPAPAGGSPARTASR